MAIRFFSETEKFKFNNKRKASGWLKAVITAYNFKVGNVSVVFCSDDHLLEINKSFLKHFYYTDVITFNYNEGNYIHGDIYISIDRIHENALAFKVPFENELYRVMIHGLLHLAGFNDKTEKEKEKMRTLENFHLREIGLF